MEDALSKALVGTCWALTREMVEGKKDVKARLAATRYQDPDPKDGSVGTSGAWSPLLLSS